MTASRPAWQPNSESKVCEKCKRQFTLTVRRHHCRGCGLLVCDKCSEHRVVMPESYNYGSQKQRVCEQCYVTAVKIDYERGLEQGTVALPDYEVLRATLLEKVSFYLKLDTGWSPEKDLDGVKVATCAVEGSPVLCIRSKVLIKAPVNRVMEVYGNMEIWKKWNPYVNSRFVEQVDQSSKVITAVYDFPVIDKRDSCFYTITMDSQQSEVSLPASGLTVAAMSIEHPLCPKEKGVVRSDMQISLSRIEPVEDGKHTHFTSFVHSDPKGLIPPVLVNSFLGRGADHLRGMSKYIKSQNEGKG